MEHIDHNRTAHMIGVAEYMRERAIDYGLNGDTMYVVGLLHDVGYLDGTAKHEQSGESILTKLGVADDICRVIGSHGESIDISLSNMQNSYSKRVMLLLHEADMSVDISGRRVGFEARLEDIAKRHGKTSNAYIVSCNNVRKFESKWIEFGIKPAEL